MVVQFFYFFPIFLQLKRRVRLFRRPLKSPIPAAHDRRLTLLQIFLRVSRMPRSLPLHPDRIQVRLLLLFNVFKILSNVCFHHLRKFWCSHSYWSWKSTGFINSFVFCRFWSRHELLRVIWKGDQRLRKLSQVEGRQGSERLGVRSPLPTAGTLLS